MKNKQSHYSLAVSMLILVVVAAAPSIRAATEDDLAAAKRQFEDAWKKAASETKRSVELERNVSVYEKRAQLARERLEQVSNERRDVLLKIEETKSLIAALEKQMGILGEERTQISNHIEEQKDDLASFVRYFALSDTVLHETGPVKGGIVMRKVMRGSLGEIVEAQIYDEAILKARTVFFQELIDLYAKGEIAKERLQEVADTLGDELVALENLQTELDVKTDDSRDDYEEYLRNREVTEAELAEIRRAIDESNARVYDVQRDLATINAEVREHQQQKFTAQIAMLEKQIADKRMERSIVENEQATLQKRKAEAKEAYDAMAASKNTDRKLYLKVQEAELDMKRMQKELSDLREELDAAAEDDVRRIVKNIEKTELKLSIRTQKMDLMNMGYTEETVDAYIALHDAGAAATAKLVSINQQIVQIDQDIAAFIVSLEKIEKEREDARIQSNSIGGIPGTFMWPVKGRITAGYLDSKYEGVFGVPHRAIDIAIPQGSPVFSVSDGVVYTVRDGGAKGYSYILIGHRDGYTSLYGHMSKMYVQPGDVVDIGQVIGLSGGKPGTPGAGYMTTGPHVHLEIHKDGKHVNPLSVLSQ